LVLGNYLVLSRLGEGGMGAVFRALHRRMRRLVAVKLIPPEVLEVACDNGALPSQGDAADQEVGTVDLAERLRLSEPVELGRSGDVDIDGEQIRKERLTFAQLLCAHPLLAIGRFQQELKSGLKNFSRVITVVATTSGSRTWATRRVTPG
jgi:serine/threonine protein kinase